MVESDSNTIISGASCFILMPISISLNATVVEQVQLNNTSTDKYKSSCRGWVFFDVKKPEPKPDPKPDPTLDSQSR